MSTLVDGSNLLGRLRLDRHSVEAKRALAQRLASFARSNRTRVLCFFDGEAPDAFATSLGALTIRFSKERSADDLIAADVDRAPRGSRIRVVTSDATLAARVTRRNVEVIDADAFARILESADAESNSDSPADWEEYFSNPKNRNL
ncbi:MAG TPA: NYN domain-containing protein [Thermoanaerobaculia bacterium]